MPKNLGEFIHDLIKKAGQSSDAEPIKNFFMSPQLLEMQVPEELVAALDNNLLSIKDATNNHPEIKKHYDRQVLDGLDKVIGEALADIPEDIKRAIFDERNSYKRIPLIVAKVKEAEAKKFEAIAKPDQDAILQQKEAYDKREAELTYKLRKREDEIEGIRKDADKRVTGIKIESKLQNMLGSYKTLYDDLPAEAKEAAIKSLVDTELLQNEAEFYFDDKGKFAMRKKDGTNFLGDNHQQIVPQSFIESILSRNKLLKVTTTDQNNPGDTTNQNGQQNPTRVGGGGATRNTTLKDLARQARQDFETSSSSSVM